MEARWSDGVYGKHPRMRTRFLRGTVALTDVNDGRGSLHAPILSP